MQLSATPPIHTHPRDKLRLICFFFSLSIFSSLCFLMVAAILFFFGKHYRTLLMIRYFYYIFSWEIFLTKILGKKFHRSCAEKLSSAKKFKKTYLDKLYFYKLSTNLCSKVVCESYVQSYYLVRRLKKLCVKFVHAV